MDTVLTILGLAVLILVVVWVGRRIAAHARRALSDADAVQLALEEARAEAVKLGWDEINVEALDAKRGFRRHVERLSRPDVPFKEVAQLAQSASAGVAALGLSAIARRDDVPERWTDDAIKSLSKQRLVGAGLRLSRARGAGEEARDRAGAGEAERRDRHGFTRALHPAAARARGRGRCRHVSRKRLAGPGRADRAVHQPL